VTQRNKSSEGSLVTPEKLPYGKGYSIVEVQAPCACGQREDERQDYPRDDGTVSRTK